MQLLYLFLLLAISLAGASKNGGQPSLRFRTSASQDLDLQDDLLVASGSALAIVGPAANDTYSGNDESDADFEESDNDQDHEELDEGSLNDYLSDEPEDDDIEETVENKQYQRYLDSLDDVTEDMTFNGHHVLEDEGGEGDIYAFLNPAPVLVPAGFSNEENSPFARVTNTPGEGLCGWAAISAALYGHFREAQNLREHLRDWIDQQGDNLLQVLLPVIETAQDAELSQEDIDGINAVLPGLSAPPGLLTPAAEAGTSTSVAEYGFQSDLTTMGTWALAVSLDIRVLVYRLNIDGNAELVNDINPLASGQAVHLFNANGFFHWEALIPTERMANLGLALQDTVVEEETALVADLRALGYDKTMLPRRSATDLQGIHEYLLGVLGRSLGTPYSTIALSDCPPSDECFYVRILRFSSPPGKTAAGWVNFIETERDLTHNWLQANVDPNIQRPQVVIIILQRSAFVTAAQLLVPLTCDNILPPSSRPVYLAHLMHSNMVCELLLTSEDGLLVDPAELQNFLLDNSRSSIDDDEECLPLYPVRLLSWRSVQETYTLSANHLVEALGADSTSTLTTFERSFLDGLTVARVHRLAKSLAQSLSSTFRHRAKHLLRDSERLDNVPLEKLREIDTHLVDALQLGGTRTPHSLNHINSLPKRNSPISGFHYRAVRYSKDAPTRQLDTPEKLKKQTSVQTAVHERLLRHFKVIDQAGKSKPLRKVAFLQGSTMRGQAEVASDPTWRELIEALKANRVLSWSISSEDGLLSIARELQELLLGDPTNPAVPNFPIYVGGGINQPVAYDSGDLVRSCCPDADMRGRAWSTYSTFQGRLLRARVARHAHALSNHYFNVGRNNQLLARTYEDAPSNSFQLHRSTNNKLYWKCTVGSCQAITKSPQLMAAHYTSVHGGSRVPCTVEGCTATFIDASYIAPHIKVQHEGDRPHACSQCDHRAQSTFLLAVHVRLAHSTNLPHVCPICNQRFAYRIHRQVHERLIHFTVHEFRCHICIDDERSFATRDDLNLHFRSAHASVYRWSCPVAGCVRSFTRSDILIQHRRSVHETENFPCTVPECHLTFSSRRSLWSHLQAHEGKYRYFCPKCESGFLQASTLKNHLKAAGGCDRLVKARAKLTTPGALPYGCDGCIKRFGTATQLRKHQKNAIKGSKRLRCTHNPMYSGSDSEAAASSSGMESDASSDSSRMSVDSNTTRRSAATSSDPKESDVQSDQDLDASTSSEPANRQRAGKAKRPEGKGSKGKDRAQ